MAEAFYGLPEKFGIWAFALTTDDMHVVMEEFEKKAIDRKIEAMM